MHTLYSRMDLGRGMESLYAKADRYGPAMPLVIDLIRRIEEQAG